jgi:hypothetical protein
MLASAFRTLIENEIGNPTTNDASSARMRTLILQWMNQIYREVCGKLDWHWLETLTSVNVLAGAKSFAVPATVRRILDVLDKGYTPYRPLTFIEEHTFWVREYDGLTTGEPDYWHQWAGNVYFDATLGAAMSFQYRSIANPVTLVDGTTILIPDANIGVMQDGVLARALLKKKDPAAGNYQALYEKGLAAMVRDSDQTPKMFYASRPPSQDVEPEDLPQRLRITTP